MTTIPEIIIHYQKSIEKSESDRSRLLHCINKLYKLPITVNHLQETGIGRTVNTLRKDEGEVGVAAKALVAKWKAMVAADESSEEGDHDAASANEDEDDAADPESHSKTPPSHVVPHPSNTLSRSNQGESHSIKPPRIENDAKPIDANGHHKKSSSSASSSQPSHHKHLISPGAHSDPTGESPELRAPSKTSHSHHKSSATHKASQSSTNAATSQRSSSSSHHSRKANHSNKLSSLDVDMFKPDVIKTIAAVAKQSTPSNNHSTSTPSSSISDNKEPHRKSHKSTKSHKEASVDDKDPLNGSKSTVKHSSSKHDRHSDKRKHESSSSSKHSTSKKVTDDTVASPQNAKKAKHEAVVNESDDEMEEIDSSMGTSFADALGMFAPSVKSPKKSSASTKSNKAIAKSTVLSVAKPSTSSFARGPPVAGHSSSSSSTSSRSDAKQSKVEKPIDFKKPPTLLTSANHLAPLDAEIGLELPTISNNYRPMPLNPIVMDCVFKNVPPVVAAKMFMTDEELGASMSSKTMRTKVYSGVKTGAVYNVTSLHEMCIRVLQRNIDALEYTGGVPFDIIKPILERASPEQLLTMEHFNPYLIEDTDHLWSQHCNRKFRAQKRHEYESWRDMFCRCTDEQASRLSHLTKNIKLSQTIAVPLKQTKITFVDSVVKPPRDVIKKQNRFGTERTMVATPAARVPTLKNTTSNIAQVGDVRLRVSAGMRDNAQVQSSYRPKKAPLMAKSLQLLGRFKR